MTMVVVHWRPLFVAALAVALGVLAIAQTGQMSELGRVFPMTASLVAVAAGLGVVAQVVLSREYPSAEAGETDYVRAGLLALTLLGWALALGPLGFMPTSTVAIVVVAMIARREPMSRASILYHSVAGVVLVVGLSLLLSEVLNVRLP